MKKVFILLMIIILTCGCAFNKNKTEEGVEVLPLMSSEAVKTNRMWVGTFQLVWNDLMDEIVKGPIEFVGETPQVVNVLNKQDFKKDFLSENSYYKTFGKASYELKKQIEKSIKEKFNETSDIIDSIDWSPAKGKFVVYAMLKKDFKFLKAFDKLEPAKFGKKEELVDYFGIKPIHNDELGQNIEVLFYNTKNDFAVKLYTQGNDVVYLYRTNDDKSFDKLYFDMNKKTEVYEGRRWFGSKDYFKVPDINLYQEKHFSEVCNRQIKGTDIEIAEAIETIDFKMNNEGVKLKSEAIIVTKLTSAGPGHIIEPRYFYLDDTFVLFLQEKDKAQPYFALRVDDAALINKTGKNND